MLMSESEVEARLSSPLNLMNRLKDLDRGSSTKNSMAMFGIKQDDEKAKVTVLPPLDKGSSKDTELSLEDVLKDGLNKIKLGLAHDKAVDLLDAALETLASKMDDIKPERLPGVITSVSKMVEGIRKERAEANKINQGGKEVHLHFYSPTQKGISDYDEVEVA